MTALKKLRYLRSFAFEGEAPPVLAAFDNARVIDTLKARGVAVRL